MKRIKIIPMPMMVAMVIFITPLKTFSQATGGGGSGGGGLMNVSSKGGCEEGRQVIFFENEGFSDRQTLVTRTCRNGSYMTKAERADYIYNPSTRCSPEGSVQYWDESSGGDYRRAKMTCLNGKWVER